MKDKRDRPIDLVAELLSTPAGERAGRLAKLEKPMLVELAAAALEGWTRERARASAPSPGEVCLEGARW